MFEFFSLSKNLKSSDKILRQELSIQTIHQFYNIYDPANTTSKDQIVTQQMNICQGQKIVLTQEFKQINQLSTDVLSGINTLKADLEYPNAILDIINYEGIDQMINLDQIHIFIHTHKVYQRKLGAEDKLSLNQTIYNFATCLLNNYFVKINKLLQLSIFGGRIKQIDQLSKLSKLQHLSLEESEIGDISALRYLKDLMYLNLSANVLSDIRPLRHLNLQHLQLAQNYIVDIQPISHMKNLKYLDLQFNLISDVSCIMHVILYLLEGVIFRDDYFVQLSGNLIEDTSSIISYIEQKQAFGAVTASYFNQNVCNLNQKDKQSVKKYIIAINTNLNQLKQMMRLLLNVKTYSLKKLNQQQFKIKLSQNQSRFAYQVLKLFQQIASMDVVQ
ncbi:leucine-rich_repeat domain-containing protein [Hexamita inflata]|uniref:Leucine-rich_repeat domain-containing protein n=1 Tax=Hexamita inflata TaxID=28002 RepID=A0ABP1GWK7_9EUKA